MNLHLASPDGSVVLERAGRFHVQSPDGSEIALSASYRPDPAGSALRVVSAEGDPCPAWSDDQPLPALVPSELRSGERVYRIDPAGSRTRGHTSHEIAKALDPLAGPITTAQAREGGGSPPLAERVQVQHDPADVPTVRGGLAEYEALLPASLVEESQIRTFKAFPDSESAVARAAELDVDPDVYDDDESQCYGYYEPDTDEAGYVHEVVYPRRATADADMPRPNMATEWAAGNFYRIFGRSLTGRINSTDWNDASAEWETERETGFAEAFRTFLMARWHDRGTEDSPALSQLARQYPETFHTFAAWNLIPGASVAGSLNP